MKHILAGACVAVLLGFGSAEATVVKGSFSGVITSGSAQDAFGFGFADLTGLPIKGTFIFDTAVLGPDQEPFPAFGKFVSSLGGMTITETVNHHTVTFPGAPSPVPGLLFNTAESGMVLQTISGQNFEVETQSSIGDPATVWRGTNTMLSLELPAGVLTDPDSPLLSYSGGVSDFFQSFLDTALLANNGAHIQEVDAGVLTDTSYRFDIRSLTMAPVPEPRVWLMMLVGAAGLGAGLRSRRRAAEAG